MLYQPYTRNFRQSWTGSAGLNSSQQGIERPDPVEQASAMRQYIPSSQAAMNSTTVADSYSSQSLSTVVPMSKVPPVGNMLDSVELTARYNAQNTFLSQHGVERNQAPSLQIFQIQEIEACLLYHPSFKSGNVKLLQGQLSAKRRKHLPYIHSSLLVLFLIQTCHNTWVHPGPASHPLQRISLQLANLLGSRN